MDEIRSENEEHAPYDQGTPKPPSAAALQPTPTSEDDAKDSSRSNCNPNAEIPPSMSAFRLWLKLHLNKLKEVGFHDWVVLFATVAIAVSTICYTHYAAKQWKEMSEQLETMRESNRLTRQYMSTSDGAFFLFAPEAVSYTPRTVRVAFRNQGKVAAREFNGWIETGYTSPPLMVFSRKVRYNFGGPSDVVGAFPHYEWIEMNLPTFSDKPEPPDRQALPCVKAHISFDNGFDETIEQDFCNYNWNGNWIECGSMDSLLRSKQRRR